MFRFVRAKPLDDWNTFRDRIAKPVKSGQTKIAMKRLQVVLRAIMLRRAKDATLGEYEVGTADLDGKPILVLPGRTIEVVACGFDADERAFYDALEQKSALTFNKVSHNAVKLMQYLKSGTVMANYTSVLTMLLRLRQGTFTSK